VKKWSRRGDFEDKPRTGRPAVLRRTAKTLTKKAKYKRGTSTRKIAKQLSSKGLAGSTATVRQYMSKTGWKSFRRQKKPLLTDEQRKARLKFAYNYQKLTEVEWEDFHFTDEFPKYLFQLPNPKNDVVSGSQESQVPPAYQVKQSAKWINWGGMTGPGLANTLLRKAKL